MGTETNICNIGADPEIMVTVCCLCYNHQSSVRQMLESVLYQDTKFLYEVIIHDDASTDATREIIESMSPGPMCRVKTIFQKENQYKKGMSAIAGYIMPIIRGKYIAFCEGDDRWSDNSKLQRQVDALEKNTGCTLSVHATGMENAQTKRRTGCFPPFPLKEGILTAEQYLNKELGEGRWMFHLSSVMIRRDILDEIRTVGESLFVHSFYIVGDEPLILYCLSQGDAYYIQREMSVYRVNTGGFMTTLRKDVGTALRVHCGYIDGFREYDSFTQGKYHPYLEKAILRRKFEIDRLQRDYLALTHNPEYRFILKERKAWKRVLYHFCAAFQRFA